MSKARKVVIHSAGSYDRLKIESFELPSLSPTQVRIEVRAAGVNYADVIVRMGLYSSAKEFVGWPITPGFEVAGVVTEVGADVDGFAVGDEVVAVTLFDGYTSNLTVESRYVFHKPGNLSFAQAASLPAVMMTAWFALLELAHPRPGSKILVHSAAGGVGTSIGQIGRILDCEMVGVVGGSHKVETATEMGYHHVIDKSTQDLWTQAKRYAPEGYDVICDANGVATLGDSYKHLRRAGKLVVYGFATMMPKKGGRPNWLKLASGWLKTPRFNPLDLTTDSKSILAFNLSYLFDRTDMLELFIADLSKWVADGQIVAPPVAEYALDDVAQAHIDIESGKTVGKLVLVP